LTETRKAFHEELKEVTDDVARMGGLAVEAIQAGTEAFLAGDLTAIERVIAEDRRIDDLAHDIEARTYLLMARQQPMAVDLRTLVSVLRVIHELERIGDNMVNVSKAARRLYPQHLDARYRGLIHRMREQAVEQLRLAMGAFNDRDPAKAAALSDMDDVMDDLQKELFRAVLSAPPGDGDAVHQAVQLALVGRYYERIADHAVNAGERTSYMVTGAFFDTSRPAES